jgi:DNA primase
VPADLIERFGLGYAPDSWEALSQALTPRLPWSDLEAAGLAGRSERGKPYDRFRHRLMFPIQNASGRLVGFGGRTLGDDKAKYVNTAETDRFHKGHLLYGLFQARQEARESRRAILVEGYFDVIATVACGRAATVAGMGTALTQEQARLIARYADEVVVAYDGDPAGEAAFERALPILLAEGLGVRRAVFGEGHDPDSLRLASGEAAVAAAIDDAEDAVVLQLRRAIPGTMASSRLRSSQAGVIAALLQAVRDPLMRHDYVRRAAEMLGVSEKEFSSRFKELNSWRGVSPTAPGTGREARSGNRGQAGQGGYGGHGGNLDRVGDAGEVHAAATGPRLVRSLEEQVLASLLHDGPDRGLPASAELPPAEVFMDPACRNIFRTFCTLYARDGISPPDARAVLAEVGGQDAVVDRMAQILLEEPVDPAKSGLVESLDKLVRRWRQQRLRELQSAMTEAQRRGDQARLASLVEEKTLLSRSLQGIRTLDAG